MARGQTGQSKDTTAGMPGPEPRGRKCNYVTLAGKPEEKRSMSRGFQKEKQEMNHGGAGENRLELGRQLLLHRFFFQVKTNIIHFMNTIKWYSIPRQKK